MEAQETEANTVETLQRAYMEGYNLGVRAAEQIYK